MVRLGVDKGSVVGAGSLARWLCSAIESVAEVGQVRPRAVGWGGCATIRSLEWNRWREGRTAVGTADVACVSAASLLLLLLLLLPGAKHWNGHSGRSGVAHAPRR